MKFLLQLFSLKRIGTLIPLIGSISASEGDIEREFSTVESSVRKELNYQEFIQYPEKILEQPLEVQEEIKKRLLEYFHLQEQLQFISQQDLLLAQKMDDLKEKERKRDIKLQQETAKFQQDLQLMEQERQEALNSQYLANAEKATSIKKTLEDIERRKIEYNSKMKVAPTLLETEEEKPWWTSYLPEAIYKLYLDHQKKKKQSSVERVFGQQSFPPLASNIGCNSSELYGQNQVNSQASSLKMEGEKNQQASKIIIEELPMKEKENKNGKKFKPPIEEID